MLCRTLSSTTPTSPTTLRGRGPEIFKATFIGAVLFNDQGYPLRPNFTRLPGFTHTTFAPWAGANLALTTIVISDGLACFAGVAEIGTHPATVVRASKP